MPIVVSALHAHPFSRNRGCRDCGAGAGLQHARAPGRLGRLPIQCGTGQHFSTEGILDQRWRTKLKLTPSCRAAFEYQLDCAFKGRACWPVRNLCAARNSVPGTIGHSSFALSVNKTSPFTNIVKVRYKAHIFLRGSHGAVALLLCVRRWRKVKVADRPQRIGQLPRPTRSRGTRTPHICPVEPEHHPLLSPRAGNHGAV